MLPLQRHWNWVYWFHRACLTVQLSFCGRNRVQLGSLSFTILARLISPLFSHCPSVRLRICIFHNTWRVHFTSNQLQVVCRLLILFKYEILTICCFCFTSWLCKSRAGLLWMPSRVFERFFAISSISSLVFRRSTSYLIYMPPATI